jgi:hypothetical protein
MMAHTRIYAGICGFTTDVESTSDDRRHVKLKIDSTCPDVKRIIGKLADPTWDAYVVIGPCAQKGNMFDTALMRICGELPHVACPVPAGICKAVEVAARLALPRDAHISVAADAPAPATETGAASADAADPPATPTATAPTTTPADKPPSQDKPAPATARRKRRNPRS